MKIRDLLRKKARPVHKIAGNQSVDDAINLMTGEQASALIVTENDRPVGIFAERDVFRYFRRDKKTSLSEITVQNAMTANLIVAKPEEDVGMAMAIMIKSDIKHLPVMEAQKIIGVLKLNDLIDHQIESLTNEIDQLKDYIEDLHEAGRD